MGNFNRGSRSGASRDFGHKNFGGRDSERPTMHKTTCSKCGKECEVPFRPTGSKPVFCRDCFRENGGGSDSRDTRRSESRSFDRPHFDHRNDSRAISEQPQFKEQFIALNSKLDKILGILMSIVELEATEDVRSDKEIQPTEKVTEIKRKTRTSKKITSPDVEQEVK